MSNSVKETLHLKTQRRGLRRRPAWRVGRQLPEPLQDGPLISASPSRHLGDGGPGPAGSRGLALCSPGAGSLWDTEPIIFKALLIFPISICFERKTTL